MRAAACDVIYVSSCAVAWGAFAVVCGWPKKWGRLGRDLLAHVGRGAALLAERTDPRGRAVWKDEDGIGRKGKEG